MQEVEVIKARNVLSKQARGKAIERLRVAAYCRVSTDSGLSEAFKTSFAKSINPNDIPTSPLPLYIIEYFGELPNDMFSELCNQIGSV